MLRYIRSVATGLTLGIFVVVVGLLGSGALAAPAGKGKDPGLVDCAAGDSIGDALAAGVTDITVRDLCDERIVITTSNVTIRGESLGDGIAYTANNETAVLILGAQNVRLLNLTVSGPRRAVNVLWGAAAFIREDSNVFSTTPYVHASAVTDNSYLEVRDSTVEGLLVLRLSSIRLFGATINSPGTTGLSPNNPLNTAITLNGSSAYAYGSDITGHVAVNWLSRLNFGKVFLGFDWGNSTISNTAGVASGDEIQCSAYSAVTAGPSGIVEDGSSNLLTTADIINFSWPGDSEDYCTELGFPAPGP